MQVCVAVGHIGVGVSLGLGGGGLQGLLSLLWVFRFFFVFFLGGEGGGGFRVGFDPQSAELRHL